MTPPMDELLEHWHHLGHERALHHTRRLRDAVAALPPTAPALPVPGLDWTVADVVAHLVAVARRYTGDPRRAPTAAGVAGQNAADLAPLLAELDGDVVALADDLVAQVEAMGVAVELAGPHDQFPFHAGQTLTIAGGWGNLIGELLAHGDDIGRATGVPFVVDDVDLEPFWLFTTAVLPGWLTDAGRLAADRVVLDVGLAAGPVRLTFGCGRVTADMGPAAGDDLVVNGAAATVTLAVPYGRRPVTDPALAVLGERIAAL